MRRKKKKYFKNYRIWLTTYHNELDEAQKTIYQAQLK